MKLCCLLTQKKISYENGNEIRAYIFLKMNKLIPDNHNLRLNMKIQNIEQLYRTLQDNLDITWTQGDKLKKFYLLDLFNYKYQHKYS